MFGRVVKLESLQYSPGFRRRKSFIKGSRRMSVQVVHHQGDLISLRKMNVREIPHAMSPINSSAMIRHLEMPPAFQGSEQHEQVTDPGPLIFVVVSPRLSRTFRNGSPRLFDLLAVSFIHANQWARRIGWTLINFQDVFHRAHKIAVGLRRNAPLLLQPRLNFVFFNVWRTASWEML